MASIVHRFKHGDVSVAVIWDARRPKAAHPFDLRFRDEDALSEAISVCDTLGFDYTHRSLTGKYMPQCCFLSFTSTDAFVPIFLQVSDKIVHIDEYLPEEGAPSRISEFFDHRETGSFTH